MGTKKTIGERIDAVVGEVSGKVEIAKDKISAAKDSAVGIAHDISKSVKKAVDDSSSAISELTNDEKLK